MNCYTVFKNYKKSLILNNWSLLSDSVIRQVNNSTKTCGQCQKSRCDILSNFQTTCCCDDEILLIFFVVRWVLLTRILTRVKLSWPSTSSEWFSLTFNVYVRLCCDDSNPQDFFSVTAKIFRSHLFVTICSDPTCTHTGARFNFWSENKMKSWIFRYFTFYKHRFLRENS